MREIIWVAAIVTVAFVLFRGLRTSPTPDLPADEWFQTNVTTPSESRPVVVKFGAEWCGPCRMMEAELDQFSKSVGERVAVVRVDVDEHRDLADHFGISSIPRTFVVLDGEVVGDEGGLLRAKDLQEWTSQWVAAAP